MTRKGLTCAGVSKLYSLNTSHRFRQSASDRGAYCKSTVDSLGSGRSHAYYLFLMDNVVHVCGSRLGEQDRIDLEIDVNLDLVSSSFCGVGSQNTFSKSH